MQKVTSAYECRDEDETNKSNVESHMNPRAYYQLCFVTALKMVYVLEFVRGDKTAKTVSPASAFDV